MGGGNRRIIPKVEVEKREIENFKKQHDLLSKVKLKAQRRWAVSGATGEDPKLAS